MGFLPMLRAPTGDDLAEDEFDAKITAELARRHQLLRDGELELDYISGIGEVHWRARRPRWTTEPPSKPGLYFIRRGPGFPTRVADVYRNRGAWFFEWSDLPSQRIAGAGLEFSDIPISEPLP